MNPINLTVAPGDQKLDLSWGVSSTEGLGGFKVNWKPRSPGSIWSTALLPATQRKFTITPLANGTIYDVQVRALQAAGIVSSSGTPKAEVVEPPPPPPPPTGMKVGLDSGGWWVFNDAAMNSGKVKLIRYQNAPGETLAKYEAAGYKIIDLIGHNPATGVNAESLAAEGIARAKGHPNIVATEILNEPQNPYMGGSQSQSSIEAYARLINTVAYQYKKVYGTQPMPYLLWSADGGYEGVPSWGAKVWPLLDANAKAITRPTVHPYGGTGERAKSALGGRGRVEEAHKLTGQKVWVTEVGWPTAVGQPSTGDSLQWTEAEQAKNIEDFILWAPPFAETVIIFQYRDYGSNDFYGIEHSDGKHKPSYDVLQRLA